MTAKKERLEYLTLTWETPSGRQEAMTVPMSVAWDIARAIAGGTDNEDVTLIGQTGNAKVMRDGKAYVKRKGQEGQIIEPSTVALL